MPSPALVAFCVFGVISFFAVTAQLFMCIFALRAAGRGAGRVPGTRRSYRGGSTRHPPLSPVSEGAASSNGSSTVTCAHPESD